MPAIIKQCVYFGAFYSHYKVFGVPMRQVAKVQAFNNNKFVPMVTFSDMLLNEGSHAVDAMGSDPVSFLVGSYKNRELPRVIKFDGNRMRLFFKTKTYYSFVTVVFGVSNVSISL